MTYDEAIQAMQEARVISPSLVSYSGSYHAFSRTKLLGSGATYEQALIAAKLLPKPKTRKSAVLFAVDGTDVYRGEAFICSACSYNMARRISNALNAYTPSDRGY